MMCARLRTPAESHRSDFLLLTFAGPPLCLTPAYYPQDMLIISLASYARKLD